MFYLSPRLYTLGKVTFELIHFIRISQASVCIPFLIGWIRYRNFPAEQRLLHWLIGFGTLTEVLAIVLHQVMQVPNIPVYNLFALVQIVLVNRIYARILNQAVWWLWLNILLFTSIVFFLGNLYFAQPINELNTHSIIFGMVIHLFLAARHFIENFRDKNENQPEVQSMLWFSAGILIYSCSSLLLFLAYDQITNHFQEGIFTPWGLNALMFILLNSFYAINQWKSLPK